MNINRVEAGNVQIRKEHYSGPHNEKTPVKIVSAGKSPDKIAVFFPGASPTGEDHHEMNQLAKVLAGMKFRVYLPRIPMLKELIVSPENVEWMEAFYTWVVHREERLSRKIYVAGMSFGGALLLKACLRPAFSRPRPASILVYGTYCDFESAMEFLLTGVSSDGEKQIRRKPHDWGAVVMMKNYLPEIDPGFDTAGILKNISFRINDRPEEAEEHLKTLSDFQRQFILGLINGRENQAIRKTVNLIRDKFGDELKDLSPRYWCHLVTQKVFILHGAYDDMIPYTESVKLAKLLPDCELFISRLHGHKTLEEDVSMFFKMREALRLVKFVSGFMAYNGNKNISGGLRQ